LSDVKARAKKWKMLFDLDYEWLFFLWEKQKGRCFLSGLELSLLPPSSGARFNRLAPSIDRIDSQKGYTKDNVRLVCLHINNAINEYGVEAFEELARAFLKDKGE
jgi:hypothetical protein